MTTLTFRGARWYLILVGVTAAAALGACRQGTKSVSAPTAKNVVFLLLDTVRAAVGGFPVWLGSGLSVANAAQLWPRCHGAIVGTFCKRDGRVDQPVDLERVKALRAACASHSA